MINLIPFTISDTKYLNCWIKNERDLIQFAGDIFTYPIDEKQIAYYLADNNRLVYQVIDDDYPVGHAEIYHESDEQARLCRILVGDPNIRGKGTGQLIITRLLSIAFNLKGYKRVHLNVYDWNSVAIKCYQKCGFEINPEISSKIIVGDEVWNAINMTIDKTQWQKQQVSFK